MNRKYGLDFVRAISAFGIIAYHFYCHSSSTDKLFFTYTNGDCGVLLNYLFFMLSGLVLQMKYGPKQEWHLGLFYYKRWKSTMPAYIIVFFSAFAINVLRFGELFYLDIPKSRLFLSLVGMDGYASWIMPTYFITGEWFVGAILIAYALYPILRQLLNKCKCLTLIGLIALYAVILRVDCFGLPQAVNPVVCLLCFFIGMLLSSKSSLLENVFVVIASAVFSIIMLFIPVAGSSVTKAILTALPLLIVLNVVGGWLCKNPLIFKWVSFISSLSYYTFLLHHQLMYKILAVIDPTNTVCALFVLLLIIMVTLAFSRILHTVMKAFFGSKMQNRIEMILTRKL